MLSASYYYQGRCLQTGELLKLPRTSFVEAIAANLMQQLASDDRYSQEGKMYGVLLVEALSGELEILKAFSGLLFGQSIVEGWVPPIPGRDEVALEETRTLAQLEALKQQLLTLKQLPERQQYETLWRKFEQELQQMSDRHQNSKQQRHQKRPVLCETLTGETLAVALEQLERESRLEGMERRNLKRQRDALLQPLKQRIEQADIQIRQLKKQRQELSRQLQEKMHAAYTLTNFLGQSLSLPELMPRGSIPTGTGDCCAPKLLHYAATHQLKPLAMAEFWWGPSSANGDKVQGQFYGACGERCQPLMGFLLSGFPKKLRAGDNFLAPSSSELPILYEDEWLIAVNKPAGLLSVPGRSHSRFDSVLSRLRSLLPDGEALMAVHRLDQETSGILLLAKDLPTYRQLSQQFEQRQVRKVYEAILSGCVTIEAGAIALPLWGDPENRPYQQVDSERGKPSLTHFRVLERLENSTRVEFFPLTGRTHQLRVHAADTRGLGIPILGDRLYGCAAVANRLHLHARELSFQHPQSGQRVRLRSTTPF